VRVYLQASVNTLLNVAARNDEFRNDSSAELFTRIGLQFVK